MITQSEIKDLIPHRDPFLFVDKCEIIEEGIKGIGYRRFLESEYFFKGHFPDIPIVPGVVLVESLAQTAGIVISKKFSKIETTKKLSVLFMSVSKAKFRKPVLPNYDISLKVRLLNTVKTVYKFAGEGYHDNIKVCEAEFSAMITNN